MVTVLLQLLLRFRIPLAETAGVAVLVAGLAQLATWAALVAVGVVLLLKAAEWEMKRNGADSS